MKVPVLWEKEKGNSDCKKQSVLFAYKEIFVFIKTKKARGNFQQAKCVCL